MVAGSASAQGDKPAQEPSTQPGPSANSISAYEGLTVQSVQFPQVGERDQQRLLDVIAVKVGEPLDRSRVRQSVLSLYATGRFSDIGVEAERTPDGQVALKFATVPNYFIGDV